MDETLAMTVPPPLPAKTQVSRMPVQGVRQTVSIRTPVSPPSTRSEAGATVFVGGVSESTTTWRIPEVRPSSTDCREESARGSQAAHVVKIRINPEESRSGRVISTVRLTVDECNTRSSDFNHRNSVGTVGNAGDFRAKEDSASAVARAKDSVNGDGGTGEVCARISVGGDHVDRPQVDKHRQVDEMVRRGSNDALHASLGRTGACFYYAPFQGSLNQMGVTNSGQCSPSDTLDSGTCSDLDGTPPPLPKKKNASTVLLGSTGLVGVNGNGQHNRTGSLTSSGAEVDSDDNESNISCDSLNCGDLIVSVAPDGKNGNVRGQGSKSGDQEEGLKRGVAGDPDSVNGSRSDGKRDVNNGDLGEGRPRNPKNGSLEPSSSQSHGDPRNPDAPSRDFSEMTRRSKDQLLGFSAGIFLTNGHRNENGSGACSPGASPCASPSPSGTSSLSKASSTPRVRSPEIPDHRRLSPVVKECTYEERTREQARIQQECAKADFYANYNRPTNGAKYLYDDDRFYKFHVNEHQRDDDERKVDAEDQFGEHGPIEREGDEYFAGYKILDREAIRSAKGTVRGVKNRVRAGIATFLQKPSSKNYKAKDAGKVVVYTTTMGIVRETYYACTKVKQILRTHMVKYEERDMFMSTESQTELKDRIGCTSIRVPQLFIDGQYIGDADAVERLNESGELRRMLKPYKSADACTTCKICGGYGLLPCPVCNGSKKSVHRNDFTTEFVALKCMNCDEVGLVRCQHC
ncbi:uncharacterized protein LOC105702779 [Orussus abietinus]|uniref:uncharacterized protein LOC105702779 n=1 Tax=Orussus abietinus TaxID=222816 RepID=UPI000625193A|nr:uncharacterized protein LOC105702779 [Orussus abietinus]